MKQFKYKKNWNSWGEIYQGLLSIDEDKKNSKAGLFFEIFALHFYKSSGNFKNVWLRGNAPISIKKKLAIISDYGVDIVVEKKTGEFVAVQVKFRKDQNLKLNWSRDKISNLVAHNKFNAHWVFSNCQGVSVKIVKRLKVFEQITINDLEEISKSRMSEILCSINGSKPKKRKLNKPRFHQKKAIKDVVAGFKVYNRGQIILPCGAGKSLTSLWVKEELKPRKTLVLVPSLYLLRQIKHEWLENKKHDFEYLCVCSEDKIINDDLELGAELGLTGLGVTTNPEEIKKYLRRKGDCVVFSTYQSSPMIEKALKNTKFNFDLVICDEAHKTSGVKNSIFSTILFDKKIPSGNRLFMTATPKVYSGKLDEKKELICDMSNEDIYGPVFYKMSFREAIDYKYPILTDYKILGIEVNDNDIKKHLNNRLNFKNKNFNYKSIMQAIALLKAMKKYNLSHGISFHSTIKNAKNFNSAMRESNEHIYLKTLTGKQSTKIRRDYIKEFQNTKQGFLMNSRCLTEGIDIKKVDTILFSDPKSSLIDIVQASGRALRLNPDKEDKIGYIICPLLVNGKESFENLINESSFETIVKVLRAMYSVDEKLEDELTAAFHKNTKSSIVNKKIILPKNLKLELYSKNLLKNIKENILLKIISKSSIKTRYLPFKDAHKFVLKKNIASSMEWRKWSKQKRPHFIPSAPDRIYKNSGWVDWPHWLIGQAKVDFWPFERAHEFVLKLNLKAHADWVKWSKIKRPAYIPGNPSKIYKNVGWVDWPHWFTGQSKVGFWPFERAHKYVLKLKLSNETEWREWSKKSRPSYIPANPNKVYENNGWIDWPHWLTGQAKVDFWSFERAHEFVLKLNLKAHADWVKWSKQKRPHFIPSAPNRTYKNVGWVDWPHWFTGQSKVDFWPFERAHKYVLKLKLSNETEWREWSKSSRPGHIPGNPGDVYKTDGWVDWPHWLRGQAKVDFWSFERAHKYVLKQKLKNQKEWQSWSKNKRPAHIPGKPDKTYRNKGWINLGHWLNG